MSKIEFEDIQVGDYIKATVGIDGILIERLGKVARIHDYGFETEEKGTIWHTDWYGKYVFDLIDRPKPPLPTEPGTIILAETSLERVQLILHGDSKWWYLDGSSFYTARAVSQGPWRLLKLVDA